MSGTTYCKKCNLELPFSEFYFVNGKLKKPCKKCCYLKRKKWKETESGKASVRNSKKKYMDRVMEPKRIEREKIQLRRKLFFEGRAIRREERLRKKEQMLKKREEYEKKRAIRMKVLEKREEKKRLKSMGKKYCSGCQTYKDRSEYYKNKYRSDGLTSTCKVCKMRSYRLKKPDMPTETEKVCSKCNILKKAEEFGRTKWGLQSTCKKCYVMFNLEKYHSHTKEERKNYLEKVTASMKRRYYSNDVYRIRRLVSRHILYYLKNIGSRKTERIEKLLGYKFSSLIESIGSKPDGNFHLDHKIPVSWFNDECPVGLIWDIRNLWWVSSEYNLKKSNKWCDQVDDEYCKIIKPYLKKDLIFNN